MGYDTVGLREIKCSGQYALLQAGCVVYFSGESGDEGEGRRSKVELDWLFARVSPVPKCGRRR